MSKEIANKAKKEIYIKCKKCADEIFGDTRKKMKGKNIRPWDIQRSLLNKKKK